MISILTRIRIVQKARNQAIGGIGRDWSLKQTNAIPRSKMILRCWTIITAGKGAKEVVGKERVELDVRFLHKIEGAADYIYSEEIELPDYGKNCGNLISFGGVAQN